MKNLISRQGLLTSLAVAAGLLAQQHAHSAAQVTVFLDNHQFTLTDLAPDDGIAPSVTWGQSVLTQRQAVTVSDGVGYGGGPNAIAESVLQLKEEMPVGEVKSLSYEGFKVSYDASGMATSTSIAQGGGTWDQLSRRDQDFVLSPHTAITFTASARTSTSVVVPPDSVIHHPSGYVENGYFDWAPIFAWSKAVLTVGNDDRISSTLGSWPPCLDSQCEGMDYVMNTFRSYSTSQEVQDKLLSVTLTNDSDDVLSSRVSALAYSDGYATAPLSLVPETSSTAMMWMGLGSIGLVMGWRRRTRAARQQEQDR